MSPGLQPVPSSPWPLSAPRTRKILMSLLSWAAITAALAAMIGLFLHMPDRWFCGLLSLACMLGGADAVVRDLTTWTIAFFISGVLLAGAGAHAVYAEARSRGRR